MRNILIERCTPPIGSPGYTLPDLRDAETVLVDADAVGKLKRRGIAVIGDHGRDNRIVLGAGTAAHAVTIEFNGRSDNVVVLPPAPVKCRIGFEGHRHLCVLAAPGSPMNVAVTFRNNEGLFFCGAGTSCNEIKCLVEGPGRSIVIGDDGMFSWGIYLRTSDSHGIFDTASMRAVNTPQSILIEPHVWLGQDAIVMKGVTVGAGSIVAARSIVTKSVPRRCIVAGAPARVVRTQACWTRASQPSERDMVAVLDYLAGIDHV